MAREWDGSEQLCCANAIHAKMTTTPPLLRFIVYLFMHSLWAFEERRVRELVDASPLHKTHE